MNNEVLRCENLTKSYQEGGTLTKVLDNINFTLNRKQKVAILGSSGSGKTTLLNLLGGIDTPSAGFVQLCGKRLDKTSSGVQNILRNKEIGFVYQFHYLLKEFSALENVALPLLAHQRQPLSSITSRAKELLARVGLAQRTEHKPSNLSGGERQRVAIARALINKPTIVFMDEPTGNLDRQTALIIHDLLLELNVEFHTSFIIATHDTQLAKTMDQVFSLTKGALIKKPN